MTAPEQDPASLQPPSPPEALAGGAKRRRGEWFWRGEALRQAQAYRKELPALERARLENALLAAELADRAYDPVDALRTGSSLALSVSLYREAAYWGLLAQDETWNGPDLASLFQLLPAPFLEFAAGGQHGLAQVRAALVERSFVQTASLPAEVLPVEARAARDFVNALIRHKLAPESRVGTLLLQRGVRSFGLSALLLATLFAGWFSFQRLTMAPDMAQGKPWRASSVGTDTRANIFFHTLEEKNPWVELDLGRGALFSVVEVTNRSDCCPDRAAPLAVEVSDDRTSWREVSRRPDTFGFWKTKFVPQKARFVRLRALRRTILHLEKVSVRAH